MARASSVPRPRGYKPYVFRQLEESHLHRLRQFLRFLYSRYDNRLNFWGDLTTIILDVSVESLEKSSGDPLETFFPDWDLDECLSLQGDLLKQFNMMLQKARKSPGFLVPERRSMYLRVGDYSGAGEIFYSSFKPYNFYKRKDLLQIIVTNVARHLHGLRADALRPCHICGRYFLRLDIREVRYCSPTCRYRAIDQRRRGKRTKAP